MSNAIVMVPVQGTNVDFIPSGDTIYVPLASAENFGVVRVDSEVNHLVIDAGVIDLHPEIIDLLEEIKVGNFTAKGFYAYDPNKSYHINTVVYDKTTKAFYVSNQEIDKDDHIPITNTVYWNKEKLSDVLAVEQSVSALSGRVNTAEINISNLQSNVGTLSNLNTEDKSNLVNAINEVLENAGGADEEFVRGLINEHNGKTFTQGVHPEIKTYVDNQNNLQNLNINENTSDITDINTLLSNIVPGEASAQNELADKAFVNSTVNSLAAFYITKNAAGDSFATYDELSEAETYYSGGEVRIPTRNDYAIVQEDSLHDDATTRYIYNNGWEFQFVVNETPLTAAQLATLNSGLVAADKAKIENALEKVKTQTVGQNTTEVDIANSGFDLGITFKENGTTLKQVTLNKDGLSVVDADTQEYVRPIINGSEQMAFLSDTPAVDEETIVTNSDNELEAVGLKGTTENVTADEILEAMTINYVGGE